jgi:hypothetical protein
MIAVCRLGREPPYQDDVRDWCNGVLTLLDDIRRQEL